MLVVCERWDGDRLLYWPSSTSFSSWLGCSTVSHWVRKALCLPLALNSASCLQLTQTVCALVILLFNVHLLPLFFRLFTQVHLFIDGSVEGQYITSGSMKISWKSKDNSEKNFPKDPSTWRVIARIWDKFKSDGAWRPHGTFRKTTVINQPCKEGKNLFLETLHRFL